ncbi:MAG: nucleotidyltransferase family protein [Solirubrobacteraceae bacterium]
MSPSPEYDLLLDAIVPINHERADLRTWDSVQWGQALRVADWHRLSPMLHCHLKSRGAGPAAVCSALERAYLANAARSLFLRATQSRVIEALAAAGVPSIPLKGAGLVETVYADPAQREMLDLDLLVPASQLDAATAALAPLGYRPPLATDSAEPASTPLTLDAHHAPALVGEQELLAVELHRHVAIDGEGSGFQIDGFWQRAHASPNGGHLILSPEDMLLHVCLHFTRNRLGGSYRRRQTGGALGQICDIARIVEHRPLDWERLGATVNGYGLGTMVFLGLFAAQTLGVAIPDTALAGLRPAGFDRQLGSRLVTLRVLRDGDHLPPRTLRWMLAPSREVLSNGWNADPTATTSLARAYMRRARAHLPEARSALRRPLEFVQDRRLNEQIRALENRT